MTYFNSRHWVQQTRMMSYPTSTVGRMSAALEAVLDLIDEADKGDGNVPVYLLDRAITDHLGDTK